MTLSAFVLYQFLPNIYVQKLQFHSMVSIVDKNIRLNSTQA
jgi:hypothetical protein